MSSFNTMKTITASLLLALFVVASPLSAMAAPAAPTAATSTEEAAPSQTQAVDDMSVTDMAWPTGEDMASMEHAKPKTFGGRLVAWLGMWHPAVIHFPIALLLTAALLEAVAALRRKPAYAAGNKLLLGIATLGAFVAAPLGWLGVGLPAPDDEVALTIHRWLGTALPFLLALLWAAKRPADQAAARIRNRFYVFGLTVVVLLILTQAYFGAEVTHGAGHLRF